MKIVHVVASLDKGGAEKFVVDLCNQLAKSGQNVYIISLFDNESSDTFIDLLDKKVTYYSLGKKQGLDIQVLRKLKFMLQLIQPQILHTHLNTFEYVNILRPFLSEVKYFHTIHNQAEKEVLSRKTKLFRSFFYKRNKVIPITISEICSQSYQSYYGLQNDIMSYNGASQLVKSTEYESVSSELKNYPTHQYCFVHVGRIMHQKNQQLLIKAVLRFNKQSQNKILLLLIGDKRIDDLVHDLESIIDGDPYIQLLGGKLNVADYVLQADAFCLSSIFEGMPISLIEAMSVGCVPISTNVGGIKDMITDGVNGFLSTDLTVEKYYDAIEMFVSHPDKEQLKAQVLHTYNTQFSIVQAANSYLKIYNNA